MPRPRISPEGSHPLAIRIPKHMFLKLKKESARLNKTVSLIVRELIESYFTGGSDD
jgi:predicted DNA-binding protein